MKTVTLKAKRPPPYAWRDPALFDVVFAASARKSQRIILEKCKPLTCGTLPTFSTITTGLLTVLTIIYQGLVLLQLSQLRLCASLFCRIRRIVGRLLQMPQTIAIPDQMLMLLIDLAFLDKRIVADQLLHQSGSVGVLGLQALSAIWVLGFDAVHFCLVGVDLDYHFGVNEAITLVPLMAAVAFAATVFGLRAVRGLSWVILVVVAFVSVGKGQGGEEYGRENRELHRES
jgi:hypothetical protein